VIPIDFIPTNDPLLRTPHLDHVVVREVLGLPTRFETNSPYALGAVADAFRCWPIVDGALDPLRVVVVVYEGADGGQPIRHFCPDATRIIVHAPGAVGVSDPERRASVAYVTTAVAGDRERFRTEILEALTLALLSRFDRHPIHAAAIARNGRAVLLAGASGVGKSTLTHLAHKAGIFPLSEDRVWVQLAPRLRVWGWPGRVRLRPSANESKVVIDLTTANWSHRDPPVADDAIVCLLDRSTGLPALTRLDPIDLARSLGANVAPGFDRFPERHDRVISALSAHGGWRLALSDDPRQALPLLRQMLDTI
jgi:hypothetical protein